MIIGTLLVVFDVAVLDVAPVAPARFKPVVVEAPCFAAALIGDKVGPLIVRTLGSWFTLVIDDVSAFEGVPAVLAAAVVG